ncbi:hypothetical protein [Succinatimonas hippei]|uniref:hypothetical protein n=1 Tax=Succinatimonas hippei TaxID=626938 RepID=UPI0006807CA4|nr:hypothetical protein [Succinatimonas hippei]
MALTKSALWLAKKNFICNCLFNKTISLAYSIIHCGCKWVSGSSIIKSVLLSGDQFFNKIESNEKDFIPVAQSISSKIFPSFL